MSKNSGFSMVELLVVIAVMAVISAIAVPNFLSWIPEKRLRSACDELYSNLNYAKMGAIKNNNSWAIVFTPGAGTYQIQRDYGGANTEDKTVMLSDYGSGVTYGLGNATQTVSNGSLTNDTTANANSDGVTYASPTNTVVFNSRGMIDPNNLGYVYFTNVGLSAGAVGTGSIAGIITQRVWVAGSGWQ